MMNTQLSDILRLSIAERIQLAADIWDSIAAFPEAVPIPDEQKQELDRRLYALADNPHDGISWDDLKAQMRKSA